MSLLSFAPSVEDAAKVVEHHLMDTSFDVVLLTKLSLMALLSGALLTLAARKAASNRGLVPVGFLQNAFEGVVVFVRDEMVRPTMGHHGDKLVPYFCSVF